MSLPQPFTNIVVIKYVARMLPDETKSSGNFSVWKFKQRPRGLRCAWEGCENEAIHPNSRDSQIAFCILHYEQEEED